LPDSIARNLSTRVIGRSWYGAPQGTSISCPELFLLPVAKLRPRRGALSRGRAPDFISGHPSLSPGPPVLRNGFGPIQADRAFGIMDMPSRARLWIVAAVRSQQPSANQRVRNLHHEGTVRRPASYTPITGGFVLDLLGCISARVLQCEGTLFFSRTGAGSLRRSHHRGALHSHHPRGGKRIASAFPLLRASRGELTHQPWRPRQGSPHPSTDGGPRNPPVPLQGRGAGHALHWPVTTALIHEPLSA